MRTPALASALLVLSAGPALAQRCGGTNTAIVFCDGCTFEQTLVVEQGRSCSSGHWLSASHAYRMPYVLTAARITERARNGIAGASETSLAYNPNPGFSGQDRFAYELTARLSSGQTAKVKVNVQVTVR